jgi:hypothetical protein
MIAAASIVGLVLVAVWIAWNFFSRQWDNEEKLAKYLVKNREYCAATNVSFRVGFKWEDCDVYILPEGLLLKAAPAGNGFPACYFFYTSGDYSRAHPGSVERQPYKLPHEIRNGWILCYEYRFRSTENSRVRLEIKAHRKLMEKMKAAGLVL